MLETFRYNLVGRYITLIKIKYYILNLYKQSNTIYKRIALEGGAIIFNDTKNNPVTLRPDYNGKINIMILKYITFDNIVYVLIIMYKEDTTIPIIKSGHLMLILIT